MSLLQVDVQTETDLELKRQGKLLVVQAVKAFFLHCIARGDFPPFDTEMYATLLFGLVDSAMYDCFCLNGGEREELYRERLVELLERILFGPALRS